MLLLLALSLLLFSLCTRLGWVMGLVRSLLHPPVKGQVSVQYGRFLYFFDPVVLRSRSDSTCFDHVDSRCANYRRVARCCTMKVPSIPFFLKLYVFILRVLDACAPLHITLSAVPLLTPPSRWSRVRAHPHFIAATVLHHHAATTLPRHSNHHAVTTCRPSM